MRSCSPNEDQKANSRPPLLGASSNDYDFGFLPRASTSASRTFHASRSRVETYMPHARQSRDHALDTLGIYLDRTFNTRGCDMSNF